MAIYEDFDLDVQSGIKNDNDMRYATEYCLTKYCTVADTCKCSLDSCAGTCPR